MKGILNTWQEIRNYVRRRAYHIPDSTVRIGRNVQITSSNFSLGSNTVLHDNVRIRGEVTIGETCKIHQYALIDARGGSVSIGSNCSVNDYCVFYGMGHLSIGNDVRIATHTVIVTSDHIFTDPENLIRLQGLELQSVTIEDNVWIGMNVTILGGVHIGYGAVIGAGAVVTKSIPAWAVAVGNPAKVIRYRVETGIHLNE